METSVNTSTNIEPTALLPLRRDLLKSSEPSFLRYVQEIQKFPILTPEEEHEYGIRYADTGDKEAAKMLLQSHLRLVVKMAAKFKNYGLPISDLVSEGNVGLIQAVKKFDPRRGFRFSTYAMWWIRAHIQEYILRSWSLVKIGTTLAQKKLFFNLNKIKKKLGRASLTKGSIAEQMEIIAKSLNVSKQEVINMDSRLHNADISLNQPVGDTENEEEMLDMLASSDDSQEKVTIASQEKSRKDELLNLAMTKLTDRERDIITKRQMSETVTTIEELGKVYKVSRERIRQIEAAAIEKIKKEVKRIQKERNWVFA